MARHNDLGKWGEQIACDTLVAAGCAIVDRNWRIGHYEIDIVAMRGDRLIFVEVKTRSGHDIDPLDAVDRNKINHMVRSANKYLEINRFPHDIQFDLIAVTGDPDDYKVDHIPDAFYPPLRTY